MAREVLISGAGIGGLAAALAASRAGWDVRVVERADVFSEVGAGIQLGPNAVRVLQGWGLLDALRGVAAFPDRLEVRCAITGQALGVLPLGETMVQRYGAPYATVHRADLHGLLLAAVQQLPVRLHAGRALASFSQTAEVVTVRCEGGTEVECDALIGADGLWSAVRQQLLGDGLPQPNGHLAYRALVAQQGLPERLRSQCVTAWLGPRMHVVQYPVRGGEFLNVVAFVEGTAPDSIDSWDHSANAKDLAVGMAGTAAPLQDLLQAIHHWRLWVMSDRPPMQGAHQHALGRVALLGDAAHPMRPYLAQGAGMALEDAAELGRALSIANDPAFDVPVALQRFALNRWQRNARVQARALRNGRIFHADGVMRRARDASLRLLGERLLDMPWLYGGRQGTSH